MRRMSKLIHVETTNRPQDPSAALEFCSSPGHGAVDLFIGRVRDFNQGKSVLGVSYDLHETLCRNVFQELAEEPDLGAPLFRRLFCKLLEDIAAQRLEIRLWLSHRHGRLDVGDASVIAAASSRHRDAAFRACRQLVEEMKHRAPIWKQEHYTDGDSEWVQGHALCSHG